jgi:hypothetical protein
VKKLKIALVLLFILSVVSPVNASYAESKYINRFPVKIADFKIGYIQEDLDLGGYREALYRLRMSPDLNLGYRSKNFYFECGMEEVKGEAKCEEVLALIKKHSQLTFDLWEVKSTNGYRECTGYKGLLILPSVNILFETECFLDY